MVQVQCCKRDIINEMGIRAKRTCPCWESRGSQAVGQSGRQGHGAPGKVKKLWRMLWHKKQDVTTGLLYNCLFFFLEKLMSHHFCHILVDQNDINIISSNEALEGVLQ